MLGQVWYEDRQHLRTRRVLTLSRDRYLRDHVFGPSTALSGDTCQGLPVVPFTFGLELVAEAACRLAGFRSSSLSIRALAARRWLAVDGSALIVDVDVKLVNSQEEKEVLVTVSEVSAYENMRRVAFEGRVSGHTEKGLPPLQLNHLPRRPNLSASEFNAQTFHGPLFTTVQRIVAVTRNGIDADLRTTSTQGLFGSCSHPRLVTPAVLLDAAGQLIGYWLMEQGLPSFVLPVQLARYEQFLSDPGPNSLLSLRLRISLQGLFTVADIEVTDCAGRLLSRLIGLRMTLCSLPSQYMDFVFRHNPAARLSRKVIGPALLSREIKIAAFAYLEQGNGIWGRVLAHMVMTTGERARWRQLDRLERLSALLVMIAVKEVFLDWLSGSGLQVEPSDVSVQLSETGATLSGSVLTDIENPPVVTITRTAASIIAAAVDSRSTATKATVSA